MIPVELNWNKKLDDAMETLRDVPVFGYNTYSVDFRWPRERDLLKMPTNKPI